jgi:predicted dehydrogenase
MNVVAPNGLQRLRLGIIGCGAITECAHLPAALASPLVEIAALCDSGTQRVRYLQRLFALADVGYTDYRAIFDRVDAVVLAVPNHLHAPIAIDFLSRGIHVLCEKPLATTSADCERLCNMAHARSAVLAVGYVTRFFPSTFLTKQLIDSKFLGVIHSFEYEFGTSGGWSPLSGYNLSRTTSGGGVLPVSGSHFLDRMLYLFDNVSVITFEDDSHGGVEANCVAIFEASVDERPIRGTITLSKTHQLANRLRIFGDEGVLEVKEGHSSSVTFLPANANLRHEITCCSNPSEDENYFRVQLENFVVAIRHQGQPLVTGEQAWASVSLMEACYRIATRLSEPWVAASLQHLRAALPGDAPVHPPSYCTESQGG